MHTLLDKLHDELCFYHLQAILGERLGFQPSAIVVTFNATDMPELPAQRSSAVARDTSVGKKWRILLLGRQATA